MAFAVGGARGPKSDINVTPLVDVVLVLLIIFMVITPLLHRGKDVRLPYAKHAAEEQAGQGPVVLSITADRVIYWGTAPVALSDLGARVTAEMTKAVGIRLLIKADESLKVGDVRPVLDRVRGAGARDIVLAADSKVARP